jgi:hypothetical protein
MWLSFVVPSQESTHERRTDGIDTFEGGKLFGQDMSVFSGEATDSYRLQRPPWQCNGR